MVLASAGRRYGLHLGQAGNYSRGADHGADEGPEEACKAAVVEPDAEGHEYELPGCHVDRHEAEGGQEAEVALELLLLAQALHVAQIVQCIAPDGVVGVGRGAAWYLICALGDIVRPFQLNVVFVQGVLLPRATAEGRDFCHGVI